MSYYSSSIDYRPYLKLDAILQRAVRVVDPHTGLMVAKKDRYGNNEFEAPVTIKCAYRHKGVVDYSGNKSTKHPIRDYMTIVKILEDDILDGMVVLWSTPIMGISGHTGAYKVHVGISLSDV